MSKLFVKYKSVGVGGDYAAIRLTKRDEERIVAKPSPEHQFEYRAPGRKPEVFHGGIPTDIIPAGVLDAFLRAAGRDVACCLVEFGEGAEE